MITLGLFSLVVNGVLLAITAGLSNNLDVGGFLGVIVAAFVISVIEAVLGFVVGKLMPVGVVSTPVTGRAPLPRATPDPDRAGRGDDHRRAA